MDAMREHDEPVFCIPQLGSFRNRPECRSAGLQCCKHMRSDRRTYLKWLACSRPSGAEVSD